MRLQLQAGTNSRYVTTSHNSTDSAYSSGAAFSTKSSILWETSRSSRFVGRKKAMQTGLREKRDTFVGG